MTEPRLDPVAVALTTARLSLIEAKVLLEHLSPPPLHALERRVHLCSEVQSCAVNLLAELRARWIAAPTPASDSAKVIAFQTRRAKTG